MTIYLTVYSTYPTLEDAQTISRTLLERKLVACANIIPAGQSLYWWEGKIQDESEVYVFYKTTKDKFESVEKTINELHPYEVPCIVATSIVDGHMPYLKWIGTSTD